MIMVWHRFWALFGVNLDSLTRLSQAGNNSARMLELMSDSQMLTYEVENLGAIAALKAEKERLGL